MKKISIIIPLLNEEQNIPLLIEAVTAVVNPMDDYEWELLFVDDGSTDNSFSVLCNARQKDGRIQVIELSRNFGKECAMLAGMDHTDADAIIIMDADLQHSPLLIPEMVKGWEEGYEDVYVKRNKRGKESWLRRKLSLSYYRLLQASARFKILENVGDYRLLDRCCIEAITQLRETERYTKGIYSWIGFRKKELLFDTEDRAFGESKWSVWSLVNLGIEGITSFSIAPLRFASVMGILVAFGAILYMLWTIIKTIVWGDPVAGYPTLITVILFLGGVQLIALGIIGEYIGRIYNEAKRRPAYIVRSINGNKKLNG